MWNWDSKFKQNRTNFSKHRYDSKFPLDGIRYDARVAFQQHEFVEMETWNDRSAKILANAEFSHSSAVRAFSRR